MKMKIMHFSGMVFTVILGTVLHFTYRISGENQIAAVFSAVNESTWEHLKLLFWPIFLWNIPEYLSYGKEYPCFFKIRFLSMAAGMIFIVSVFYTYTGVIGENLAFMNILLFFAGAGVVYALSCYLLSRENHCNEGREIYSIFGWILLAVCFALWTFFPPELGMFRDPR